nr:MAG TPA: hypothetical protein [Caudoviricetes sp.]
MLHYTFLYATFGKFLLTYSATLAIICLYLLI